MLARFSKDLNQLDVIRVGNLDCLTSSPKACVKLKFESHDLDDKLLTGNKTKKIRVWVSVDPTC